MITDEQFLKSELDMGIGFHNEGFTMLAKLTVGVIDGYDIKSVMDFGAGTGVYADAFHNAGFETYAYEIWPAHKNYIKQNAPHVKIIDKPITTDLMVFIEVAEHMTDKELTALFKKIKPKYILFSSTSNTTEWDADWGHINIKPQEEWVKLFDKFGYILEKNVSLPTEWSIILKKK